MTITMTLVLAIVGSICVPMIGILVTVHLASKREYRQQAATVAKLETGLSATRRQVDRITEDQRTLKEDVSRALERVYDKIDSVHDLVVQIALQDKQKDKAT